MASCIKLKFNHHQQFPWYSDVDDDHAFKPIQWNFIQPLMVQNHDSLVLQNTLNFMKSWKLNWKSKKKSNELMNPIRKPYHDSKSKNEYLSNGKFIHSMNFFPSSTFLNEKYHVDNNTPIDFRELDSNVSESLPPNFDHLHMHQQQQQQHLHHQSITPMTSNSSSNSLPMSDAMPLSPSSSSFHNDSQHQSNLSNGNHRNPRTRLPVETVAALEQVFATTRNPPPNIVQSLSTQFNLDVGKVRTWFNNRKAKEKRRLASNAIDISSTAIAEATFGNTRRRSSHSPEPPSPMHETHMGSMPSEVQGNYGNNSYKNRRKSNVTATNRSNNMVNAQPAGTRIEHVPGHLLHTVTGQSFSIDEAPREFTLPMFYAMRDRIIQLEEHIARTHTNSFGNPPNEEDYRTGHKRGGETYGAPTNVNKRLHVREATVRAHLDAICAQLKSALSRRHISSQDDIVLHENMTVDEFVAVFDEKGGCVSAVPKDPANPSADVLVAVEFNSQDSLHRLLGDEIARGIVISKGADDSVSLQIRNLNVLYDKTSGQVSMSFQVATSMKS